MGWAHGQSREMLKMLQSPGRLSWSSLLQGCPALVNGSTPPSHQPRAASPGACAQHSFPPRAWGAGGGRTHRVSSCSRCPTWAFLSLGALPRTQKGR